MTEVNKNNNRKKEDICRDLSVSVCIPTYNRPQKIKNLLCNIFKQYELPEEIVIVDSSPHREIESIIQKCNTCNIQITYDRSPKGLTLQRNKAIDLAKEDIILFLDDDIELDRMFIKEIKKVFLNDTDGKIAGLSGIIINGEQIKYGMGWKMKQNLGIVNATEEGSLLSCGETTPLPRREFNGLKKVDFLPGCVMAWRKAIFQSFKFPIFFQGYGLGEDKYFSSCVGKIYSLYICGTAKAKHFHEKGNRPNHFLWGFFHIYNHYFIMDECVSDRNKKVKFYLFHIIDACNDLCTWPFRADRKKRLLYGFGRVAGLIRCLIKPPKMPLDDPAQVNRKSLQNIVHL
jgi:glucosyl-dolichyl phosphate glucuronosyltransferase